MVAAAMLLLALLLSACAQTPSGNATAEEPVRIGWIGPLSGTGAPYGTTELNSARLAIEDLNARGGIDGRQVELVIEDGRCQGAAAVSAAQKLMDTDGLRYLMAGHCSTESMAIVPMTDPRKVFVLAGATGADGFTGLGKYSFRTFPSAKQLYSVLADVAYENGTRTVVTLAPQTDWSQSVVNSFAERFEGLGGEVLAQESFSPETTDFRTILIGIRERDPDAIMLSVQGPATAAQILKQMHELDMDIRVYGDTLVVAQSTYEMTGDIMPETTLSAVPYGDESAKTAFLARYKERFGTPAVHDFSVTEGYDAVMIVAELIRLCGDDTDCAKEAMISQEWVGVSGTFVFDENGDTTAFVGLARPVNGTIVTTRREA